MKRFLRWGYKASGVIALIVAIAAMGLVYVAPPAEEGAVVRSFNNCAVYTEQGCGQFVVASGGEIEVQSGGTLDLQSGSTANLVANITNSSGAVTYADNVLIDGAADAEQLVVQGYSTNTNPLFVVENSSGTNQFQVGNTGIATLLGLANLNGGIAVDTSAFTVADSTGNTDIAGTLEVVGASEFTGTLTSYGTLAANNGITVDSTAFTVANATGNTDIAGTIEVVGASEFTGTLTAYGDMSVDDVFNIDDTSFALTGVQTLNPTASYYTIGSVSNVTITLGTSGVAAGDILILTVASNVTVVIPDTNVRTSTGGALTLGQYDVVAWIFDGSTWTEMYLLADS